MDEERLDSCSTQVKRGFRKLDDLASSAESVGPEHSRAFYVLDMVDSERVKPYLESWSDEEYSPNRIALEYPSSVIYLAKLYKKRDKEFDKGIQQFLHQIERNQHTDGRIANQHCASFYALSQSENHAQAVQRAITYFIDNYDTTWDSGHRIHDLSDVAIGIQALMEIDFFEYESEIREIARYLDSIYCSSENPEEDIIAFVSPGMLISISQIPNRSFESEEALKSSLSGTLTELNDLDDVNLRYLGRTIHGLIAAGDGPKESLYLSNWKMNLQRQQQRHSRPQFVATKPSTRLDEREKGIQVSTEQMIHSAKGIIRISTLRMDMLHDELIDRLTENPEFEVRVLTSAGRPSGSRSKMKRAVMDELVKRTDGNVREDELIHTRMIIADEAEALISSADLTRDQLNDEFNAGVYTKDSETVKAAIKLFDDIWAEATPRGIT